MKVIIESDYLDKVLYTHYDDSILRSIKKAHKSKLRLYADAYIFYYEKDTIHSMITNTKLKDYKEYIEKEDVYRRDLSKQYIERIEYLDNLKWWNLDYWLIPRNTFIQI